MSDDIDIDELARMTSGHRHGCTEARLFVSPNGWTVCETCGASIGHRDRGYDGWFENVSGEYSRGGIVKSGPQGNCSVGVSMMRHTDGWVAQVHVRVPHQQMANTANESSLYLTLEQLRQLRVIVGEAEADFDTRKD